jgi:hypothetical protein
VWLAVYADTTHVIPDDMGIPSPAVLVLSDRLVADFHNTVNFALAALSEHCRSPASAGIPILLEIR